MERLLERVYADITADIAADRLVLPSMPSVAVRVWQIIEAPDSSSEDVAKAVGIDPAISARLLRVANSSFYRGAARISDVRRAVIRLGNQVVKHLVAILGVAKLYDVRAHPRVKPHLATLWQHSTLVASLADVIARRYPHLTPEAAMLAGLIHDVGVLPILVRAEKTPALLEDPRILAALIDKLHTRVGKTMLERWNFPEELVAVAAEHEDLARESVGLADFVDVVQVANILSHKDTDHPLAQVDWSQVPAFAAIGLEPEEADDLLRYAGSRVGELRMLLSA